MSLLQEIDQNKKRTVELMIAALVLLVGIGAALGYLFAGNTWWQVALWFLIGASAYLIFNYFYSAKFLMNISHANELQPGENPQLENIVSEVAQLAEIPMPKIYLIQDETQNAFATGRDPAHGQIAVTTGLLDHMNRAMIKGVIAHEASHIRNYDVRVSTIATGITAVISGTGVGLLRAGQLMLYTGSGRRRDDDDDGKNAAVLALALMLAGLVIMIVGVPMARALQFAVSRQRESLADVSAAELTRNPQGLIDALEELKQDDVPMKHVNRAAAALYISAPVTGKDHQVGFFDKLWLSHPPLDERIARLQKLLD
ncbi:M48 family metalloprotease [Lapidilactobacillus wuchangensis]|uniref:M48 family metalloprotease n=1 Tax=Lapidilactobacillus wuchangensis TaxID=2486001 RepID=UPI000F7A1079|nr:M48 family metalloprotease [Lapidilactobacillus wuchangensis]